MAIRKTKSEWLALFIEQENSGQSVAVFCRERNLSEPYFYLKRKKLKTSSGPLSTFVKAQVPAIHNNCSIQLEYGQCKLQVGCDMSPQWLAGLMKSLS